MSWLAAVAERECCDLTTTGRRTGRPHEIEIWFAVLDDVLVIVSGNREHADWFRNLVADPHVTVRVGDDVHDGVARLVDDADERHRIGDAMGAKYRYSDESIGLSERVWCYEVPAVAVEFPPRR